MIKYESALCTLNAVTQQIKLDTDTDVSTTAKETTAIALQDANTQAYLKRLIKGVAGLIETDQHRTFIPYEDTKKYYRSDLNIFRDGPAYRMYTHRDLLSINGITWVTTALTTSQYRLWDTEDSPNAYIGIDPDAITEFPSDFNEAVSVDAIWGFHRDPDNMFVDSGTTVNGAHNATVTTLAVADSANIEVYSYIKVGSEYLFVTAIAADNLTVERGARGTTAATMAGGEVVNNYQQNPEVAQAARRLVVLLYHNRGEVGAVVPIGDGVFQVNDESVRLNLRRNVFGAS